MRQCDLGFEHEDPEPEQVVVEDKSAEDVAETAAGAEVEVARINADRDVATAKIYARQADEETVATMAAMAARIDVLEAALAPPPPPEPEELPVEVPEPEPEPEPESLPDVEPPKAEGGKKGDRGWWAGYR